MKKSIWAAAALVVIAGLAACSGSSSGVVGTWVIDVDKTSDPMVDKAMAMIPEEQRKAIASMTAEQKAMLPPEQREQIEAVSSREGMKKLMMKQSAGGTLEVKSDGTFAMRGKTENDASTGTWVDKDGAVTFTPKTHAGKPAEGEKAKSMTAKWEGSNLVLSMEAPKGAEAAGITEIKIYFKKK